MGFESFNFEAVVFIASGLSTLLGGSWVVISGVISVLIWVISIVTLLITPLTVEARKLEHH